MSATILVLQVDMVTYKNYGLPLQGVNVTDMIKVWFFPSWISLYWRGSYFELNLLLNLYCTLETIKTSITFLN